MRSYIICRLLIAALGVLLDGAFVRGDGGADRSNSSPEESSSPDLTNAPYFYVQDKGPKRCFIVKQGIGSYFHVHLHVPDIGEHDLNLRLELRDADNEVKNPNGVNSEEEVNIEEIRHIKSTYQFEFKKSSVLSLCTVTTMPQANTPGRLGVKVQMMIDSGKKDDLYHEFKKKYELDDVEMEMFSLRHELDRMLKEADFEAHEEIKYHAAVSRLDQEVLWWPIVQVILLLITGFYQVRHLKQFFKAKRLV